MSAACRLGLHSQRAGARSVILAPTRELALQTARVVRDLGKHGALRVATLVGGDSMEAQFAELAGNPDVIVATPGRLAHHLAEVAGFSLKTVEYVVFDEADRWAHSSARQSMWKCRSFGALLRKSQGTPPGDRCIRNALWNSRCATPSGVGLGVSLQQQRWHAATRLAPRRPSTTCPATPSRDCSRWALQSSYMRSWRHAGGAAKRGTHAHLHLFAFPPFTCAFHNSRRLFEMGFAEQLRAILGGMPEARQTLLFSATMPRALAEFARAGLRDPTLIRLDAESKISPDLGLAFFTVRWAMLDMPLDETSDVYSSES